MTLQEIQTEVALPEFTSQISIEDLDSAIERYPYAGALFVLKAIKLYDLQDIQFLDALPKAAARTISRSHLKKLIEGPLELNFEWSSNPEVEPTIWKNDASEEVIENPSDVFLSNELSEDDPSSIEVNSEIENSEDSLSFIPEVEERIESPKVNSFGFSFVKASKKQTISREPFDIQKVSSKIPIRPKKNQDGIIEKFLEHMPSISSPRIDFGENSLQPDLSVPSTSLNEDIVTENMALIYLKQRNYEKALEIYRRLKLKFPEKSAFFAALIKNIENTTV